MIKNFSSVTSGLDDERKLLAENIAKIENRIAKARDFTLKIN
jgi:site-specific DNA recombinase